VRGCDHGADVAGRNYHRLPGLLRDTEAISLNATDMRILDNCISRALYKIFGVSDNECMLHMRHCLGLPSLMNMIETDAVNW